MRAAPDHYRGRAALQYEARRSHRPPWAEEQAAIAALTRLGPVLDVPIGTGRYLPIYRDKGLAVVGVDVSPDMLALARAKDATLEALVGSVFALPFPDGRFGTAVCTRLLNWFRPDDMVRAVRELLRVAWEVVLSIRLGLEREWGTYTHSRATFLGACDGALLDGELELHPDAGHGRYSMIRLRRPTWSDVVAQFDPWHRGEANLLRLAREWADRWAVPHEDYTKAPIRAEWWSTARLRDALEIAARREPRVVAAGQPNLVRPARRHAGPLTFIRWGADRIGILDGRHRADKWLQTDGIYSVLVLECGGVA